MAVLAQAVSSRPQAAYLDSCSERVCGTIHSIPLRGPADTDGEYLSLRVAHNDEQKNLANQLINRMYSWRGYGSHHRLGSARKSVTITASHDEEVIGTLTLTVDSPAGLAADDTFKEELAPFRGQGARLCELTKFAFDSSEPSKYALAALFHIVFILGSRRLNCTDFFIEVNPRHRRFYETMLGFKPIGQLKSNASVSAPSQLMWLSVSEMRRRIDQSFGSKHVVGRSLYPYSFSAEEEDRICARLEDVELGSESNNEHVVPRLAIN